MFGSQLGKWAHWIFGVAMGICFAHMFLLWREPDGAWLSFLGDVTGAAIGAGAAVIVAMATLDHQRHADRADAREERSREIDEQLSALISFHDALELVAGATDDDDMRSRLRHAQALAIIIRDKLAAPGVLTDIPLRRAHQAVRDAWLDHTAHFEWNATYDFNTGTTVRPPLPEDTFSRIERIKFATREECSKFRAAALRGF